MLLTDLTGGQAALLLLPILPNLWSIWHAMRHDFPGEREKYLETVMEMLASGTESVYDGLRGGAAGREKPSKKKNGQDGVRQDDKPDENGRVITFPKKDK